VPLTALFQPGIIQRVQALAADISRSRYVVIATKPVHRLQIYGLPNSAQLGCTPYYSPSYIRVRAVVLECSEGQTDRHTDAGDQYTFRVVYDSREM